MAFCSWLCFVLLHAPYICAANGALGICRWMSTISNWSISNSSNNSDNNENRHFQHVVGWYKRCSHAKCTTFAIHGTSLTRSRTHPPNDRLESMMRLMSVLKSFFCFFFFGSLLSSIADDAAGGCWMGSAIFVPLKSRLMGFDCWELTVYFICRWHFTRAHARVTTVCPLSFSFTMPVEPVSVPNDVPRLRWSWNAFEGPFCERNWKFEEKERWNAFHTWAIIRVHGKYIGWCLCLAFAGGDGAKCWAEQWTSIPWFLLVSKMLTQKINYVPFRMGCVLI